MKLSLEELEKRKKEARKVIDDWIADQPEHQQERLRAFNWNLQQRVDRFKDPVAQMNEMLIVFWEQVKTFEDALNGKFPEPPEEPNVVSFKPKVDKEDE